MDMIATAAWAPERLRPLFGAFSDSDFASCHYLDSAATSQRLIGSAKAQFDYEMSSVGNAHRGAHALANKSSKALESARSCVGNFLNIPASCVAFVSGASEASNLLARAAAAELTPSDVVYSTVLEHHSNYLPWQRACEISGAQFKVIPVTASGELDLDWFESQVFIDRPSWLSITAMSNVTGNVPPLAWISELSKRANPKALIVADAAQAVAHAPSTSKLWGADWAFFSGHKIHGPSGIGVLAAASPELFDRLEPGKVGGGMIRGFRANGDPRWASGHARFEAGSSNVGGAVGLAEALREVASWDRELLLAHEESLSNWIASELAAIPGVLVLGGQRRHGVVSFHADWAHAHDVGTVMEASGVFARVGHHCALPLMKHLGISACSRISLCCFSTVEDAVVAVAAIRQAHGRFT